MPATVSHAKVISLPGTAVSGRIYFLKDGAETYGDLYVGSTGGTLVPFINEQRIIDVINTQGGAASEILIADDIAARDALVIPRNSIVVVIDASADPTVTSGAAQYLYRSVQDDFIKLGEFESLDVVIDWSDIQNRPSSSVVQIDDAVTTAQAITDTGSGVIISGAERSAIATNSAKVSADGSVTSHSDVTNAGSGEIITTAERNAITANSAKVSANGSVTTHNDVTSAGSGQIITSGERTQIGTNATDISTLQSESEWQQEEW